MQVTPTRWGRCFSSPNKLTFASLAEKPLAAKIVLCPLRVNHALISRP